MLINSKSKYLKNIIAIFIKRTSNEVASIDILLDKIPFFSFLKKIFGGKKDESKDKADLRDSSQKRSMNTHTLFNELNLKSKDTDLNLIEREIYYKNFINNASPDDLEVFARDLLISKKMSK